MVRHWRSLSVVALAFCLFGFGCPDAKSYGMGRWPIPPLPDELVLSAEETAALTKFATEQPALVAKIKKQSDSYRLVIVKLREEAIKVNRTQLKALGYSDEEMPEQLREKKQ